MSLPPSAAHGAAGARAEDAPNSTALRQGDRIRTLHDITDEKSPDGKSTTTPTEKAASARRIPDLRDEAAVRAFWRAWDLFGSRSRFFLRPISLDGTL